MFFGKREETHVDAKRTWGNFDKNPEVDNKFENVK